MYCQLCSQPLGAGANNTNICQACTAALGKTEASPHNPTPPAISASSTLPSHLRLETNAASPASSINPNREQLKTVQQFLNTAPQPAGPPPSTALAPAPNSVQPERPLNASSSSSPFGAVATCSRCGNSYALDKMYRVHNRNFLSKAPKSANICASCLARLQREWRKSQDFKPGELALAATLALALGIVTSLLWAWTVPVTFQVTVFVIVLIGWGMGNTVQRILGKRKGPLPAEMVGGVTLVVLILAFYFLYSQLGGSVAAGWDSFTKSLQKYGLPIQTVLYFLIALVVAVGLNLAFEPEIYDSQGQRVGLT